MRVTESQLRRIIREEASRLLPEGDLADLDIPGMSRYGLYGDILDTHIDDILAPVAKAVARGRAELEELVARQERYGSRDPEAQDAIWAAFDAACRGRSPRR